MDKGHGVNLVAEAQSKAWRYQIGVTQVLTNSTELDLEIILVVRRIGAIQLSTNESTALYEMPRCDWLKFGAPRSKSPLK